MRVIYNGVDLFFLETQQFDWEPVYDPTGVDYLYTRVSFLGRALVNGQADVVNPAGGRPPFGGQTPGPFMSYRFDGDVDLSSGNPFFRPAQTPVDGVAPAGPGVPAGAAPTVPGATGVDARTPFPLRNIVRVANTPLLTHQTIRHRLTTPRKKLYVFNGPGMETGSPAVGSAGRPTPATSILTLESPAWGGDFGLPDYLCDCKNGPLPRLMNVAQSLNDLTLVVDWGCETFVDEAPLNNVVPNGALLSNRFSSTHTIGEDGYTRISVVGDAIFRTDLIFTTPDPSTPFRSPDVDRAFCMLPIPLGFVREQVDVTGMPDVTGIHYSFVDRQVPVNFTAGPYARAAKISVNHRQSVTAQSDILPSALAGYERFVGALSQRNFARMDAAKGGSDISKLADAIVAATRAAGGPAAAAAAAAPVPVPLQPPGGP
jgi:hypothetical protein